MWRYCDAGNSRGNGVAELKEGNDMPIADNVVLGENVVIHHPELVNLYGCEIGERTKIADFVEIGAGVTIGRNCKIETFAFIPAGVTIEDNVFVGPHVCFTNDRYPPSGVVTETLVKRGASIGAGSVILCGVRIGENAKVGAGAVVLRDVEDGELVVGSPAGGVVGARWGGYALPKQEINRETEQW